MNPNEYFKANDDGIGTDPTMVEVIESLDVLPEENKAGEKDKKEKNKKVKANKTKAPKKVSTTPNPDKKPGDLIKKIIFVIIILLLMAGVAYGVYFYLSLGRKKNVSKFTLEDKVVYLGDNLSSSVIEYGDFSTIDISECNLDISSVKTDTVGEYPFSVTCGKTKYSAKIFVTERIIFNVEAVPVYKNQGDTVDATEFFKVTDEGYSFEFIDAPAVESYLSSGEGLYQVDIKVINNKGNETILTSVLYVLTQNSDMKLTCNSAQLKDDLIPYNIIDVIALDAEKEYLDLSIRTYSFVFADESEFELTKNKIENGKLTIEEKSGYALVDNINKRIKIVDKLKKDTLDKEYGEEFPKKYVFIKKFYQEEKKYSCSL